MPVIFNRYFLTWLVVGVGLGALLGRVVSAWGSVFWLVAVGAACVVWWRSTVDGQDGDDSDDLFTDLESDFDKDMRDFGSSSTTEEE